MNARQFFEELKRRSVYKVAVTYGIVAWLAIQVSSILLPTFEAPAWVMQALTLLLIVCFPFALILAWAFEMSPDGIIRTTSDAAAENPLPDHKKKPFTSNLLIGFLLLVIVGQFTYTKFWSKNDIGSTTGVKSIAVLPFKNMSGDPDMEAFCDGMTDAVISRLTKIEGIGKVISRTSVMTYKKSLKSMPEIADELGVTHILEAGFQKSGNIVMINLQLINGPSDDHFWSDEYTGAYKDIFKLQSEVAEQVARNMNTEITDEELIQITKSPTYNIQAYEYYVKGRKIHYDQYMFIGNESAFFRAKGLFEKAIEQDSSFAEAYAAIADLYDTKKTMGHVINFYDFNTEYDSLLFAYAGKGFELNPNSSMVNYTMAWVYLNRDDRNFDRAYNHMAKALQIDPEDALNYWGIGVLFAYLGMFDYALEYYNKALEIDPMNWSTLVLKSWVNMDLGNIQQMEEDAKLAMDLSGQDPYNYHLKSLILDSRFDEAQKLIAERDIKNEPLNYYKTKMHIKKNERDKAQALLNDIDLYSKYYLYVDLEMKEEVYEQLNTWIEKGVNFYLPMTFNSIYDPFREDPVFQALLSRSKQLHEEYKMKYPKVNL